MLVAVQDTAGSIATARRAAAIFSFEDAEFVLVNVLPAATEPISASVWGGIPSAAFMEVANPSPEREAEGRAALQHASAVLPSARRLLVSGLTERAICDAADEIDADVIVVGRSRPRRLRGRLTGPISRSVVRSTARPVLVV